MGHEGKKLECAKHGPRKRGHRCAGAVALGPWLGLLLDLLFGAGIGLVELAGLAFGGDLAKRLLQELAGLEAVAASVAPGLDGGLALRRDSDFDDAGHQGSSCMI